MKYGCHQFVDFEFRILVQTQAIQCLIEQLKVFVIVQYRIFERTAIYVILRFLARWNFFIGNICGKKLRTTGEILYRGNYS